MQDIQEFRYDLKIPRERVAVIIGKDGSTKRALESLTTTRINVDSDSGEIVITGSDTLLLYQTREIVRAIARGFNPDIAQQLIKQDYSLEVLNLQDYSRNPNDLERLKGRIIGQDGKARRTIEELTKTSLCVYGKTISIIGYVEDISVARRAVESLLAGSRHGNVYKKIERRNRFMKRPVTF
ncbi:RNA-processing protein [Candidatus Woesearchaeota archaeon]|nr:RNA-processing protein [Candidatus Woesearchaeota archaeon]